MSLLSCADMAGESGPEIAYGRLRPNPAMSVSDITGFIQAYFKLQNGCRMMGQLIESIDKSGIGWKTAPQACVFFLWGGGGRGGMGVLILCL